MCGVFGFISYDKKGPDMNRLKRIATATMARGPHAWGLAWLDWSGRVQMFKRTGRIVDHLGLLAMAANARVLIGHCRYATHGSPGNNLNNHPHPADGGWIVHNGVVHNHEDLAAEYDLWPVTECDSEVLGLLIAGSRGKLVDRCSAAANVSQGPLAMLGVWTHPARLVAVRRGNPLHMGECEGGERFYLASLPTALPGKAKMLPDNTVWDFTPSTLATYNVKGEPERLTSGG